MIRSLTVTACLFLTGVVTLACSSDEADKFGSSDAFCAAKAEAECNNLAASCGATVEVCKQKRTSVCTSAAAAASGQGRSYRANAAQPCVDKVNEVYAAKAITSAQEKSVTEVCERVFGGVRTKNQACVNTFECEGSLICDLTVCTEKSDTKIGEACNNPGQRCQTDSYCQLQGVNKFCVAANKENETCAADSPCIESLRCVNRCIPKVTVGNPCDEDSNCAEEAPYCDTALKKCRPKYQAGTAACRDYGSTL